MFPENKETFEKYPLQSKLFGHRFKDNQSLYEYILEFLLVAVSKKTIGSDGEMFPISPAVYKESITYKPEGRVGLKRFIFFEKSKKDGRFPLDESAYKFCLEFIKDKIEIEGTKDFIDKKYVVSLFQNLLYGFNAVIENRSWFAQSLLPICEESIFAEIMGKKADRKTAYDNPYDDNFIKIVDAQFEKNRYNFMARGGEVYYLHILKAINDYPVYKEEIENGFRSLLTKFQEFSGLCNFLFDTWQYGADGFDKPEINKTLGIIPNGFDNREERTLIELKNILNSSMHPFEKIDVLSYGIILQIMVMEYQQVRRLADKKPGFWIFDINFSKGNSRDEVKKLASNNYIKYEEDFINAIYKNIEGQRNKDKKGLEKSEEETVEDTIGDSIKVYRKLGKKIGIIRPLNEKGIRFTINENILKFLVTSLIPPSSKITLDRFLYKIYDHFKIIIGQEEYKREISYGNTECLNDISFLDRNREDFQIMLKECGFLRELSDSTSIVENPYKGGL